MTPLSTLLRQARIDACISQAELARMAADATGRDPASLRATIAQYEREGGREPRPPIVAAVLDALWLDIALVPRGSGKRKKAT